MACCITNTCKRPLSIRASSCSRLLQTRPIAKSRIIEISDEAAMKAPVSRQFDSISNGPREFEISPKKGNPAFDYNEERSVAQKYPGPSFKHLGLKEEVLQSLESMNISQPTIIQLKCIPEILKGRNVFCAAQTGSGKTLAYLAPILHRLKCEEAMGLLARYHRPRVCIVSPFRELSIQILKVVKTMSRSAPVRSLGLIGGQKDNLIHKGLKQQPVDIIVGTPGTILEFYEKRKILFTDLKCIVFDEADTMLDSSFKNMTGKFLESLRLRSQDSQIPPEINCIFAAATLPNRDVIGKLKSTIPKLKVVEANIHQVLPHVRHKFKKTSQPEKPELLLDVLKSQMKKNKKIMIFVNTSGTCNWLSKFLQENEIYHKKLSGNVPAQERQNVFEEYIKEMNGVLLCTDVASRGLDCPELSCVVNYDCPLNPTDYIHRAGRTGRVRAEYKGIAEIITFLSRNWELNLARSVQFAADKMTTIKNVDIVKRDKSAINIKQ